MKSFLCIYGLSYAMNIKNALNKVVKNRRGLDMYRLRNGNHEPTLAGLQWVNVEYIPVDTDGTVLASIKIDGIREFFLFGDIYRVRLEALGLLYGFVTRKSLGYEKKLTVSIRRMVKELMECTTKNQHVLDHGLEHGNINQGVLGVDVKCIDLLEEIKNNYATLESVTGMTMATIDSDLAHGNPYRELAFVTLSPKDMPPLCSISKRNRGLRVAVPVKKGCFYDVIQFSDNGGAVYCGRVPAMVIHQFMGEI